MLTSDRNATRHPARGPIMGLLVMVASALPSTVTAATAPAGFEFFVSTYTTGDQSRPVVASRGQDGFVIVWSSFGQAAYANDDVFARLFDAEMVPDGPPFLVNQSTAGDQSEQRIAGNRFGEFVIVWTDWVQGDGDGQGVKARRYDSLGRAVGSEFVVNSTTTGAQYRPDVAMNDAGAFVVTWASQGQDGSDFGIFGRLFDVSTTAVGSEFQANTYTTGAQSFPRVSMDTDGSFVVGWRAFGGQDGSGTGAAARLFDNAGAPVGGELKINEATAGNQILGGITHLPGGEFVVVWGDETSLDGDGYSVQARLFDTAGSPVGGDFQVNTTTLDSQRFPTVDADPDAGRFVVAWTSTISTGTDYDIQGQSFLSNGTPAGLEFAVNSYTSGVQRVPEVAVGDGGAFVVSWIDDAVDGSGHGVVARRFFGRAPEMTGPRPGDIVDCADPRVIRPTFTWTGDGYDLFKVWMSTTPNFLNGTFLTSGDTWLKTASWTVKPKKWKNICLKALASNPSSPVMFLRIEGKDRDLPKKDPARRIFSATVAVVPAD